MDGYTDYQEFLSDLAEWGEAVTGCGRENRNSASHCTVNVISQMLYKAKQGAEHSVFSPFLYLVLSAGLDRDETLFLAAVLYSSLGVPGQCFTYEYWTMFWNTKDVGFSGAELFYQAHSLLYEKDMTEDGSVYSVRLRPQIFLFLSRAILEERKIPGMRWYYRSGEPLPFLGNSLRNYDRMHSCRKAMQGKLLFYLHGQEGIGRKLNYAWLAAEQGRSMAVVRYEELHSEAHLQDILTECLLHHALLVVEIPEKAEECLPVLLYWMEREKNVFLTGTQDELLYTDADGRRYVPFGIDTQAVLGDRELFEKLTGNYPWEQETDRQEFLGRYDFLPGKMKSILELAMSYAYAEGRDCITAWNLRQAVLHSGGHSLRKYAKKVHCAYTMEDLILPDIQKRKLLHICSRVKNRKFVYEEWGFQEKSAYGNGVSMIFAGSPGTGKTMAAQVIAAELGMELYRVELPAVVDKYIGETEKKLNRIFEEAADSMAILFFDEADVLFSKRTEIKESNDKYSNMEIAFLLQKMEEYEGVSILATNYLQNFDEAFRRRISEIIDFPIPDEGLREKMWQTMLPARLPVSSEMDYSFLAKQFQVTGSVIKNALIYGAFLAAESRKSLTMEEVLKGLGHELEKSGRKLSRQDYGEYYDLIEDG